jgi:3',5'-cyclic AMP phosphodiesterase CpdA
VRRVRPHVVAVSGDLTQRARPREFEAAREFLEALPKPQIVVPGNHDVPLHDPFGRFVLGFAAFREFITADPYPFHSDREIAVIGVNTARSLAFKGGRINGEQVDAIRQRLCSSAPNLVKVVVTHHPFDKPKDSEHALVARAGTAMKQLAVCGVDIFLSGHLHTTGIYQTAVRYRIAGHSALVVHAGTATSTRGRGEPNSFNVLYVDRSTIRVERYVWDADGAGFTVSADETFEYTDDGWVPAGVQSARHR